MADAVLECPSCRLPLPDGFDVAPTVERCDSCGTRLRFATFPALFRSGEATCFHHEQKRAVTTCDACGKFLCQLCDVEVPNGHFCTHCFEAGARKGSLPEFERARTRYDKVVWSLVLLSLLFWFLSPLLPLAAIILGVVKRKAPPSLVHRSRLRLNLALAVAALEFLGGCAFWISVWVAT
jgi:hypothetical protein